MATSQDMHHMAHTARATTAGHALHFALQLRVQLQEAGHDAVLEALLDSLVVRGAFATGVSAPGVKPPWLDLRDDDAGALVGEAGHGCGSMRREAGRRGGEGAVLVVFTGVPLVECWVFGAREAHEHEQIRRVEWVCRTHRHIHTHTHTYTHSSVSSVWGKPMPRVSATLTFQHSLSHRIQVVVGAYWQPPIFRDSSRCASL